MTMTVMFHILLQQTPIMNSFIETDMGFKINEDQILL